MLFALCSCPCCKRRKATRAKMLALLAAYVWATAIVGIYYGAWITLY